jgi:hypothetical protein
MRTIAEITAMLVEHRALAVLTEYNSDREPKAVSFRIQTEHGLIAFQLPARVEQVVRILSSQRRRIKAQLAMVQAELVSLTEVFLPYAQDAQGRTFYEAVKAARFPGLLLEDKAS